jgi:hypothetical protein
MEQLAHIFARKVYFPVHYRAVVFQYTFDTGSQLRYHFLMGNDFFIVIRE